MDLKTLAKKAVENYIKYGKIIKAPKELPQKFLNQKAGTFVTIEEDQVLRGCIGTYLPTKENIAQEIIYNAIAAASQDYRFRPIQIEELTHLSYTIYILDKPQLITDLSELDPKIYGILVTTVPIERRVDVFFNGHAVPKSGLLLPDLKDINTPQQQFLAVCQKANIDPNRERIFIYRFTAEKL